MSKRDIGMFCGGLVTGLIAGAVSGVFAVRRYYDKLFLERESDLYDRIDAYKLELEESMHAQIVSIYNTGAGLNDIEHDQLVQAKWAPGSTDNHVAYNKMYREGNVQPPTDEDDEDPEEEESEYGEDIPEQDVQHFEQHQQHLKTNRKPRLITEDDYNGLEPHIAKSVLQYYSGNKVLCDEMDEPIEDAFRLVGDALDKYDFANSNELVVFVRNYVLDTAYEVQRIPGEYVFLEE